MKKIVLLLILGALLMPFAPAQAAEGITLDNPVRYVTLGQLSQIQQGFTFTNSSAATYRVSFSVQDENFTQIIAGAAVSEPSAVLAPGEKTEVIVTIPRQVITAEQAEFSLVATYENSEDRGAGVGIVPRLAGRIVVRPAPAPVNDLKPGELKLIKLALSLPLTLQLPISNSSSVFAVPRGTVSMVDASGKAVARGIINEDSLVLMPGQTKTVKVSLVRLDDVYKAPGEYKVLADIRSEGAEGSSKLERSFFFVSLRTLIVMWLTLILALVAVLWQRSQALKKYRR